MQTLALTSADASAPRYVRAEAAILDAIRKGRFRPGSRLPNERALAREMGVAPMTLRQAMRRLAEEGIIERRPRVGTFVRQSTLAPNIALLIFNESRLDHGVSPLLLQEMQGEARGRGHDLRPMLLARPYPPVAQLVHELRAMNVGGAALLDFLNTDADYIRDLAALIPCALMNKGLAGVPLPCAAPDMFAAARLVVGYLAQRGRKALALVGIHLEHQRHVELATAFESECLARGMPVDKRLWYYIRSFQERQGMEWFDRMWEMGLRPDGVVLVGAGPAGNLAERLARHGVTAGKELDLVEFRLSHAARREPRSWPVLAYNDTLASLTALRMLMDTLEGKPISGQEANVRIPPDLILPAGIEGESVLATGT